MSRFFAICSIDGIPEGTGRQFKVGDREIALFRVGGRFYALDGLCPHAGGPLGEGEVEGDEVICPWHGWVFRIATGDAPLVPEQSVSCIPVRVENDQVLVDLS